MNDNISYSSKSGQVIITSYSKVDEWVENNSIHKILLVCDSSIKFLTDFNDYLDALKQRVEVVPFSDFQPNPLYSSVVEGVMVYRENGCDSIMAIGGGSAIDVAKCIKLYTYLDGDGVDGSFLTATLTLGQSVKESSIPFLAMPTTAGTGSEATRYAVVYYDGKKQSVTSTSFIPDTVLMDPRALSTLPIYQKKSTMCDALCHAIESFWSVNSTDLSKEYSKEAIKLVLENMNGYLANTGAGNAGMLRAAHTAGQAINITQTTAGHAMCYKITSLYHVAHGHAAMLCDRVLYPWMIDNTKLCIDPRGEAYLKKTLYEIGVALGCKDARGGAEKLEKIFEELDLSIPIATDGEFKVLKTSVNPVRLKNHPVKLDEDTIDRLYHKILKSTENK